MDDDSIAGDSLVKNLLSHITKNEDIGIVSAYQLDEKYPVYPKNKGVINTILYGQVEICYVLKHSLKLMVSKRNFLWTMLITNFV